MKNQSNIKVRIPKALFELFRKEYGVTDSKGVLKEMLKSQLTGMLTESTEEEVDEAAAPNIKDTGDESNLQKALDKNPTIKQYLGKIGANNEIDGALATMIDEFGLQNMPKSTIITALKTALENLAPKSNSITTVGDKKLQEAAKKVIRIRKK